MDQSFEHNSTGISYPKRWKDWKRKRRCTLHVGMVLEGFVNFIPKNDPRTLETIWIIVNETRNKDLAPKTLDELRQ